VVFSASVLANSTFPVFLKVEDKSSYGLHKKKLSAATYLRSKIELRASFNGRLVQLHSISTQRCSFRESDGETNAFNQNLDVVLFVQVVCKDLWRIRWIFRFQRDVTAALGMQDGWEDLNRSRVVAAELSNLSGLCAIRQESSKVELQLECCC